jgi:hypothetical protein
MGVEAFPRQESQEPLTPQEEVFLHVVESYKRGECPHLAGRTTPHERGQQPVGAFCSQECLDHFEHEYRVKHGTEVNVISDQPTLYGKGNLNTCVMYPNHAMMQELRRRRGDFESEGEEHKEETTDEDVSDEDTTYHQQAA